MIVKINDRKYKLELRKKISRWWLYEYYVILKPLEFNICERLEGYIGRINKESEPFVAFFGKKEEIHTNTFNELRNVTKNFLQQKYGD